VHDGRPAVKAASLGDSDLWRRINASDPALHMPPRDAGQQLQPEQIALLGRWIEQGAVYQKHWAFEPPARPDPPAVHATAWPRNELDRFILATLESRQLQPSPEAPRETLIRRVTLDLTGLPPTLERWTPSWRTPGPTPTSGSWTGCWPRRATANRWRATGWTWPVTATRMGCTSTTNVPCGPTAIGWSAPSTRTCPTISSSSGNSPATCCPSHPDQLVASGFNRCNVSTSEGGAIDQEFQARYAVDRVETTSTAFMGLTLGCAVCHDHKLDPISQKEFYQVFSIFNNLAENAMDGNALLPPPTLKLPSPLQTQQLEAFDGRLAQLDRRLHEKVAQLAYHDPPSPPTRRHRSPGSSTARPLGTGPTGCPSVTRPRTGVVFHGLGEAGARSRSRRGGPGRDQGIAQKGPSPTE